MDNIFDLLKTFRGKKVKYVECLGEHDYKSHCFKCFMIVFEDNSRIYIDPYDVNHLSIETRITPQIDLQ